MIMISFINFMMKGQFPKMNIKASILLELLQADMVSLKALALLPLIPILNIYGVAAQTSQNCIWTGA
jgi:hypothetical protein